MAKHGSDENLFTYDVFLSFRGEDTRHTFLGHLHKELVRKGINTFLDDEKLRIGEDISPALSKAIEHSKVFVIVFSENYADSSWCLGELVKIQDCLKRNNKQLAVPIFYHVDPSDVRHQRNSYEKAMRNHENIFGRDSEKVQAWKSALNELASLKGQHISRTEYETKYIEEIVKDVHANIPSKPLNNDENPVGLEQRIKDVELLLNTKANDNTVSMLGIYGPGGIGKTELAKAIYYKIAHQFDAASFLANVTEKSNKINGMEELQKALLSEMLEELTIELGSTRRGKYEIRQKLHRKKVLLILDDVDNKEILENLAGGCHWFGPGSRIIITTRDKGLLIAHQVQKTYEMVKLDYQHSLKLFCQNAFKQDHPEMGYEDLSSRAVGYAQGFPLALKVIGSDLAIDERSLDAWESTLKKYERSPGEKIQGVLKVSYERLESNEKHVFLDIACFFKGEKVEYVKKILEEYQATSTIDRLVNKSLIMVDNGFLKMHDLIQNMGRSIVTKDIPNPSQRSRLWLYKDVIEVLSEDSGSNKVEGVMLNPPQQEKVDWRGDAFKKMERLRILIVRNTSFKTSPKHLPNYLRVLDWEDCPSKEFPKKFDPQEIIVFKLSRSKLKLKMPLKKFSKLTILDFSHNQSITEMPDVSEAQNLIEVRLDYCENLTAVDESFGDLKNLIHLSVKKCTNLKKFPKKLFLPSLEVLDISDCSMLKCFPDVTKKMDKPLNIYMSRTSINLLPADSIANLTGLVSIDLNDSQKLKYLPFCLFMLPNVEAIQMNNCTRLEGIFRKFAAEAHPHHHFANNNGDSKLKTLRLENCGLSDEDFHAIIMFFPKLQELIASRNNFVSLHECIKESIHLTRLDVSDCKMLQRIPQCLNLRFLDVNHCENLEEISELPSTVQEIKANYCFSLTRETSDMLWSKVLKGRSALEIMMPGKEIPDDKLFDFIKEGGYPRFWARGKFPVTDMVVALVFHKSSNVEEELIKLGLVINGLSVPYRNFQVNKIPADHVLICNLRVLFRCEEDLDALLVPDYWNEVQVSCKTVSIALASWGIFVYKDEGGNNMMMMMEDNVKFNNPHPTAVIPPTNISNLALDKLIEILNEIKVALGDEDVYQMKNLRRLSELWREGKELTESLRNDLNSDDFSSLMDYWLKTKPFADILAKLGAGYLKCNDYSVLRPYISVTEFYLKMGMKAGLRQFLKSFLPPEFHINGRFVVGESFTLEKVLKERSALEIIIMPGKEIPDIKSFDFVGEGGYPRFWTRGKFPVPNMAVALVFRKSSSVEEELTKLGLVINGRGVTYRDFHVNKIPADHVLICDLRVLFRCEEDLEAFLVPDYWNEVQVSCKTLRITLASWGIFVYKDEGRNNMMMMMEDNVKFDNPHPTAVIPPTNSSNLALERLIEVLNEIKVALGDEDLYLMKNLRQLSGLWREGKELTEFLRNDLNSDYFSLLMNYWLKTKPFAAFFAKLGAGYLKYNDYSLLRPTIAGTEFSLKMGMKAGNVMGLRQFLNNFFPPEFHINGRLAVGESSASTSAPQPQGSSEQQADYEY